jgi:hypothetical protein
MFNLTLNEYIGELLLETNDLTSESCTFANEINEIEINYDTISDIDLVEFDFEDFTVNITQITLNDGSIHLVVESLESITELAKLEVQSIQNEMKIAVSWLEEITELYEDDEENDEDNQQTQEDDELMAA